MKIRSKKINFRDTAEVLSNILSSRKNLNIEKINKPTILYGAGAMGKMAKNFFEYLEIPFLYVVDKNAINYKKDEFWKEIKILSPNKVSKSDKDNCLLVVCISVIPLMSIYTELKSQGWRNVSFFYDISQAYAKHHPLNNGWSLGKLNKKEKDFIKKVFDTLFGNLSRLHYLRFLAWRKDKLELRFNDNFTSSENRFFIPEVIEALGQNEVFADVGAHHGAVTKKFLKVVKNKYQKIYAIEPDGKNYQILKKKLNCIPRLKLIRRALGSKTRKEKFCEGFDFASRLSPKGNSLLETATLDKLGMAPTFIKMHLEGGELGALKGSVKTILKHRPLIAVTIYHNIDGAWRIPIFLMSRMKNYNYYLRQHGWAGTGVVFYAIPKERTKK